jgi:hypothetical protein
VNNFSGVVTTVGQRMSHVMSDTRRVENQPAPYKPSAFYFRQELRCTRTRKEAVGIGMHLVAELELLKQWVRDQGLQPPKWNVMRSERLEKDWGPVVPFPVDLHDQQWPSRDGGATTSE